MPKTSPKISPRIIEQFTCGKYTDNHYSEDRLVIGENCYGVIDGFRGPDYRDTNFIQDSVERARILLMAVNEQTTLIDLVGALTNMIAERKKHYNHANMKYTGGFSFTCYSFPHQQIWRVGDCQFRFGKKTYLNETEIEIISARQRAVNLHSLLLENPDIKTLMASKAYEHSFAPFFKPLLDFANHENHPLGFGEINGFKVPRKFIETIDVPDSIGEIIIASDGYPLLKDTLEESETTLAKLLTQDPLCISENIASKGLTLDQVSFDDRTYLRFSR